MKALIIEGDPGSRSFLQEAMQRRGYEVTVLEGRRLNLDSLRAINMLIGIVSVFGLQQ